MEEVIGILGLSAFLGVLSIFLVTGALSSELARLKGHSSIRWFICGLFLGPMGVLAAVGLPDLKLRKILEAKFQSGEM